MGQFLQSLIGGLTLGATFALIALGIVLIFRATDTFNFAHGELMLLGAYLAAKWQHQWHLPTVVPILCSLAVVTVISGLLFRVVLRRIVGAPPFIGLVATLGVASVADAVMSIIFGANQYTISIPALPRSSFVIDGAHIGKASVYIAAVSLVLACTVAVALSRTAVGARIRAAGQDVLLASQSGISVHRLYALSWGIGGLLAAFAGIAYGSTNVVSPDLSGLGLVAFPAILLGGLDSIGGSIIGGILTGLVQSFTASYIGGQWTYVTTYGLLLVVILERPSGLFGTKAVARV